MEDFRPYIRLASDSLIDMFDDCLEVYSPGGMYDMRIIQDQDIDNISSSRRNPIIADIFYSELKDDRTAKAQLRPPAIIITTSSNVEVVILMTYCGFEKNRG